MNSIRKTLASICLPRLLACALALVPLVPAHSGAGCEIDEYALLGYLLNPGKTCGGDGMTGEDILSAVRVLDAYWDWDASWDWEASNEQRFRLLSRGYQDILKNMHGLEGGSEYLIPSSEYERHIRGYHVQEIRSFPVHSGKGLRVALKAEWFQEGYGGRLTYIFDLVDFGNGWAIIRILH